jgi:ABC-type transporter Mla subunit MlaD
MTTTPIPGNGYVRRWVNTWVALGASVVAVICAYLLLISNSLAHIDNNLGVAQRAVSDSERNVKTLPDQLEAVNKNLTNISHAVGPLAGDAADIRASLVDIQQDSGTTGSSLERTAARLTTVSQTLQGTAATLDPVAARLSETSALLLTTLAGTGSIKANLQAIYGSSDQSGVRLLRRLVSSITTSIDGTRTNLADMLTLIDLINEDLHGVCTSAPVNVVHGRQAC